MIHVESGHGLIFFSISTSSTMIFFSKIFLLTLKALKTFSLKSRASFVDRPNLRLVFEMKSPETKSNEIQTNFLLEANRID